MLISLVRFSPYRALLLLFTLIWTISCDTSPQSSASQHPADEPTTFDLDTGLYTSLIQDKTSYLAIADTNQLRDATVYFDRAINTLYEANGYLPLWSSRSMYEDYLTILSEVHYDGLVAEDYDRNLIISLMSQFDKSEEINYNLLTDLDIITTNSFLLLSLHLLEGKIAPGLLDNNWNSPFLGVTGHTIDTIFKNLAVHDVNGHFERIVSRGRIYPKMREHMKSLHALQAAGGWEQIPVPEKIKLEAGDSSDIIPAIRRRLIGAELGMNLEALQSRLYDDRLLEEVKDFQGRHGLASDGVVGAGTLAAMNITVAQKIDIVRINMERARWLINEKNDHSIIVNIAGFKAYYLEGETLRHSGNVIIGKYQHETPIFEADMQYIEFNPTWTIPRSIIINETLPRMRKDPNYLRDRNMSLLDYQGNPVNESSVDISPGASFPYMVRQGPGPGNALGFVKFIFPNPHNVYLHDTPSRGLFARTDRAFSHGCVRVENPLKWAEILLESDGMTEQKINEIVALGDTKRVMPKNKIRVRMMYLTYLEGFDAKPYYYKDVYKRDQRVLDQLNAPVSGKVIKYQRDEIEAALASAAG
jgi:murein L,D-transpeptidase YcbB/YkuD